MIDITPREVELCAGGLAATLAGGELLTVTSLRRDNVELLVPASELPAGYAVHGRRAGITLLHPWANRLSRDEYSAAGRTATLDPADAPHLHGVATDSWQVESVGPSRAGAHLYVADPPPEFPFPHAMTVDVLIASGRLLVTTTLTATGDVPVPVAFGWHPYLRLPAIERGDWRLRLPRRAHLMLDERGVPTGAAAAEPAEHGPLAGRAFDDAYVALAPGSVLGLSGGAHGIRLALLEGYPAAQVFAPPDADVVSLEPMTAPVDALVSGVGLRLVRAGESFRAVFALGLA